MLRRRKAMALAGVALCAPVAMAQPQRVYRSLLARADEVIE